MLRILSSLFTVECYCSIPVCTDGDRMTGTHNGTVKQIQKGTPDAKWMYYIFCNYCGC